MTKTNQRPLAAFGALALLLGLSACAGRSPEATEAHHHYEQATSPALTLAPASPEEYCAEQGADGWKIVEVRCLRRLNAGLCSGGEECDLFPEMRHVEDLDSSRDIRCAGDTGGDGYADFGVTSCEYVGRDGAVSEPALVAESTPPASETAEGEGGTVLDALLGLSEIQPHAFGAYCDGAKGELGEFQGMRACYISDFAAFYDSEAGSFSRGGFAFPVEIYKPTARELVSLLGEPDGVSDIRATWVREFYAFTVTIPDEESEVFFVSVATPEK